MEINWFHTQRFVSRKKGPKHKIRQLSDGNHVLMIFSTWSLLVMVTQTNIKHTLTGHHIHFNKGKAHESIKVTSLKAIRGTGLLKKLQAGILQ